MAPNEILRERSRPDGETATRGGAAAHAGEAAAYGGGAPSPSRIAITGASGLVGARLSALLTAGGHEVWPVVRRTTGAAREIAWNPAAGSIDAPALEAMDAIVHLAGESIASGRWTAERKRRILASRVDGTRLLCETLARLAQKPSVVVCASAIGIYGNRGDAMLDETSASGDGFLAEVCLQWEAAAAPARDAGIRVVHLRLGVVLSRLGGALAQMLPPFRAGLGGRLGPGTQYFSWISLDDLVAVILHCIATPALQGAVNATAPAPVTNSELTRALAGALHRPALLPVPAFVLLLLLGEMAEALLLASTRVLPRRLLESGFAFRDGEISAALAAMLGRAHTRAPVR